MYVCVCCKVLNFVRVAVQSHKVNLLSVCVCVSVYVCLSVCLCVCVYVSMYVCVCSKVLNFVRVAVQSHKVNLLSLDRHFDDDTLTYDLPVDSKLQEFTISISGENPRISILDPQGIDYHHMIINN